MQSFLKSYAKPMSCTLLSALKSRIQVIVNAFLELKAQENKALQ